MQTPALEKKTFRVYLDPSQDMADSGQMGMFGPMYEVMEAKQEREVLMWGQRINAVRGF